jgi:flagellar basal body-associated protein FliL
VATRSTTPAAREAEPEAPAEETAEAPEPKRPAKAGFKAWIPLLITVAVMPGLAYVTTQFLILPKLKHAMNQAAAAEASADPSAPASKSAAPGPKPTKDKVLVQLPKVLCNVSGTMMTRYLMTTMTLVGNTSDFKEKIDANKDQLLDLAHGALETKTIGDLEKPGARNQMRSELMTVFNNALGGPVVQDIYIVEQAVQ